VLKWSANTQKSAHTHKLINYIEVLMNPAVLILAYKSTARTFVHL